MTRRNASQCGFRAQNRRVAGDLSPWRSTGSLHGSWLLAVWLLKELHSTLFWPSPLLSKSLLKPIPLFSINLGFFFPVLSLGWKVFSSTISTFIIFQFFSSISPLSGWEVFHQLIPCPVFIFSFPHRLGGFSLATWPYETHQLPYGARIFSVVSRFSSPVSFIGWEVFYPIPISFWRFHAQRSLRLKKKAIVITWPRSGEFLKQKSRDNNHPKLHPGQFGFHRNALSIQAPTWSHGSFSSYALIPPTHSSSHALVSPRTHLPMHLFS